VAEKTTLDRYSEPVREAADQVAAKIAAALQRHD
jgi:hypothetical protein